MAGRRPKICFVHGQLGLGGAEVLRLSILRELLRRDYSVQVVQLRSPGQLTQTIEAAGVAVETLNNRGGLVDRSGIKKLKQFLKGKQFDIVQSSQFVTNLHTRLACRSLGIVNHIIEEHGIYRWKKIHHRLLDRWFNSKAAAVIACSSCVADSAAKHLGLPRDRIDVVFNCVGEEHLQPIDLAWKTRDECQRERASLVGGRPVDHLTGIIGTLRWEKGHRFLFEAWRKLNQTRQFSHKHHLVVVGDGPLRSSLESEASDLPNVHFLGSIANPQTVLKNLDMFVLPSVNEGFGIAIIEAMAAGVPVVSTQSGGIPEVVNEGTGLLVPPEDAGALADAMQKVIGMSNENEMIAAARRRVEEHFTPAAYVDRLESIYWRLMD